MQCNISLKKKSLEMPSPTTLYKYPVLFYFMYIYPFLDITLNYEDVEKFSYILHTSCRMLPLIRLLVCVSKVTKH